MPDSNLLDIFIENPIIAAVRDDDTLNYALKSNVKVIFVLSSNICTIKDNCTKLRDAQKTVFLHVDLIDGLKADQSGINFLVSKIPDVGIISTKSNCIRLANSANLNSIQRVFMLDSSALKTNIQNTSHGHPNFVEVLPGISPDIISKAVEHIKIPIIAGGYIQSKNDVFSALSAGAVAVSTSHQPLW